MMTPEEEGAAMDALAKDLIRLATHIGPGYGLDGLAIASAVNMASTRLLYGFAMTVGMPEKFLDAVEQMNRTALKSAADMLAGAATPHQATQ